MKAGKTIRIKALLLLLVFAANTLLGFACSIGLKMGYNDHHHDEAMVMVANHHHGLHHHQQSPKKSPAGKDDCCGNSVTAFHMLDKTPATASTFTSPGFTTDLLLPFYQYTPALPKIFFDKNIRAFSQAYHPPIPNIRIAIQSFQI